MQDLGCSIDLKVLNFDILSILLNMKKKRSNEQNSTDYGFDPLKKIKLLTDSFQINIYKIHIQRLN